MSPVTTIRESSPRRVRNIIICSGVVFCASSRTMKALRERAAAHVGERRDLDDALLGEAGDFLGVEHVVQRVVERAEVGEDFFAQVAGQKAERLAGLDGGAREDDALRPRS